MSRFVFLWLCSTCSQFSVWDWIGLSMFLVFLLLSLCRNSIICIPKSSSSVSANDEESSEVVVVSEAPSSTDEYDVFLSFRGPDTRQGFTDILYETMKRAGIRVFRDDDELSIGQSLQKILHAIETSQICMPIFSQTFAESSWCLREVAKMMELKKVVVPIFYKVQPSDLKLGTGAYRNHLKMHKKKYGEKQVKVWEDALKEVTKIKGREVLNTRYTEFCKKLVDEGLRHLKPRKRSSNESLVGIDSQIRDLMKLVDIDSPDVRYIGIHGMGGIGKTTLAKALYEELSIDFDCYYFLADVRESSLRRNGLQDLQKELQAGLDLEFSSGCNYLRDIETRFRTKKVLIVLDDVDKCKQIEKLAGHSSWFGSGSRIIVTTRDLDVLEKYGKLDQKNNEVRFFKMMTLKHDQALELFQWYAFREEKPPPILKTISWEIVSTCGGLPLALQVMGSRLYSVMDEREWRDVLERSREVQDRDVKERLMISFDALEDDQKKIFLDIACIHDMGDKVRSVCMWEASKLYPHLCLAVLRSMSLIKVDDEKIWMHDLLKDLGKGIVRDEKEKHGNYSRVWKNEEVMNVLLSKEGQERVEVVSVDKPLDLSLIHEHSVNFPKLRFLKMVDTSIEGDFKVFFPKLAWLTWNYCLPTLNISNLYMNNLVVLNLSDSFINESWEGWSVIQTLNNLKDLDLSYCQNLTRTPDFFETSRLERLSFLGCSELHEIHGSVGKLQRLKYLNLEECDSLSGLPDEIGMLVNLEELRASRSYNWRREPLITFKLPKTIGFLKSLVVLVLRDLEIMDIPDSIGGLLKLKSMFLSTRAKELPESLGDLKSLVKLEMEVEGISQLPNSLGRLVKLEELILQRCTNLEELPESLGSLQELKLLKVWGAMKLRKIPVLVEKLKKLEVLEFYSIDSIEEFPKELFGLSSLRELTLYGSSISTLPSTISQLPLLEKLDLDENHKLQELPDLPLSLRYFLVSSKSLQWTPDLSKLVNLRVLGILNMEDYRLPQQLPSSKIEGIEKLTNLVVLRLGATRTITFDLGSLLPQLTELELVFLPDLNGNSQDSKLGLKFPDLSDLKNLSRLTLRNCLIEDGGGLESIQHLGSVRYVEIISCGVKLIEQICLMKNLKCLYITSCGSLRTLPNLSELENLETLMIQVCEEVVEITGLGNLESLVTLHIVYCGSLERLENLSKLENLSTMRLRDCPRLTTIEGTDRLSFNYLGIKSCRSLQNVQELSKRSKTGLSRNLYRL